jgi:hypothetical protein
VNLLDLGRDLAADALARLLDDVLVLDDVVAALLVAAVLDRDRFAADIARSSPTLARIVVEVSITGVLLERVFTSRIQSFISPR